MKNFIPIIIVVVGLIGGLSLGVATFDQAQSGRPARIDSVKIEGSVQPTLTSANSTIEVAPKTNRKLLELDGIVNGLTRDNRTLRRQLAETNRDLAELQFQVDSHSESFRPLDTGSDSSIPKPFDSPDFNPILPPR